MSKKSKTRDIILSVKPKYSLNILRGIKTVELRRRFSQDIAEGTIAFIYSTTPDQALVGSAEIVSVLHQPIREIWSKYSKRACIEKYDFDDYFSGLENGYVLQFENARALPRSLSLEELRQKFGFNPPQSFFYASPILQGALSYEHPKLSH